MNYTSYALCLYSLLTLGACALSPEEQEALDSQISDCKSGGGKAYVGISTVVKCASPTEQDRLEKLELACVESGGTVSYAYGGYYENCQRQPATIINNTVSTSGSNRNSLGKPCASGWIKNSQQVVNGVTTCFWQCDVSDSVKTYEQTSGQGRCPTP